MPAILYTFYSPEGKSVPEITQLEHSLGLTLLRTGLSRLYGLHYDAESCDKAVLACENGKPYLSDHPGIFFNITHANGLVACAFHDEPVGIDTEKKGYFPEILIKRALTDSEKALLAAHSDTEELRQEWFWRLWTLKEAYVKRSGIGVDTDLKAFSFSFEGRMIPDDAGFLPVKCSDPGASCFQVLLESGHILSLCTGHAEDESLIICDIVENVDLCQGIYDNNNSQDDPHR